MTVADWIVLAPVTVLAGLVYGFAGFGAALIAMPLFAARLGPEQAVGVFAVSALGSAATVLPQAWSQADRRATSVMIAASLVGLPLGAWMLAAADPGVLRWGMSGVVLATLAALILGLRLTGRPGLRAWIGVGGAVGLFGGATGLNGPPLVLFQLAGTDGPARSRANTIVVLTTTSLLLLPVLAARGLFGPAQLVLGMALLPVYAAASWAGRRLFTPARASIYRGLAYAIIAAAALAGLPLWS